MRSCWWKIRMSSHHRRREKVRCRRSELRSLRSDARSTPPIMIFRRMKKSWRLIGTLSCLNLTVETVQLRNYRIILRQSNPNCIPKTTSPRNPVDATQSDVAARIRLFRPARLNSQPSTNVSPKRNGICIVNTVCTWVCSQTMQL